ncbi:helix-turn-helix transcriptional regulator [Catenulispora yoronensis]
MALRINVAAQRRLREIQSQLLLARRAAELSQVALSSLAGVSNRALQDWERGSDAPNLDHLISWARELGFRLVITESPGASPPLPPVEPGDGETWEACEMRRLAMPLRAQRMIRKLTQTDLGLLLGVSRSSLQRWEDVQMFPRSIALIVWADRLGCRVELEPVAS